MCLFMAEILLSPAARLAALFDTGRLRIPIRPRPVPPPSGRHSTDSLGSGNAVARGRWLVETPPGTSALWRGRSFMPSDACTSMCGRRAREATPGVSRSFQAGLQQAPAPTCAPVGEKGSRWLSHAVFGESAVRLRSESPAGPSLHRAALALVVLRRRPERARCRIGGEGAVTAARHLLRKVARRPLGLPHTVLSNGNGQTRHPSPVGDVPVAAARVIQRAADATVSATISGVKRAFCHSPPVPRPRSRAEPRLIVLAARTDCESSGLTCRALSRCRSAGEASRLGLGTIAVPALHPTRLPWRAGSTAKHQPRRTGGAK
jgi:hypothetical protein